MKLLSNRLDEKTRRHVAGAASCASAYGGASAIAKAAKISWTIIYSGQKELKALHDSDTKPTPQKNQRRQGAEPKRKTEKYPNLLIELHTPPRQKSLASTDTTTQIIAILRSIELA